MVGNFDVDVEQQQRVGHLLSPMPPEMRNDTAFMDRLHAFAPGWDFPEVEPREHLTDHFGLVSDFLSECWSKLRSGNRVSIMQGRVHLGGALSGRDIEAVNKTVSGLMKLLFPKSGDAGSDEIWNGSCGWRWSRAEGEGAAEACASRANSGIRISATSWGPRAWSSSFRRRNCTATKRLKPIRCRRGRFGRRAWERRRPGRVVPHRGDNWVPAAESRF
jgi:hypothetical protein